MDSDEVVHILKRRPTRSPAAENKPLSNQLDDEDDEVCVVCGKVGFLTMLGEGDLYWSAFATDEAVAESGLKKEDYADVKEYLLAQFADEGQVTAAPVRYGQRG